MIKEIKQNKLIYLILFIIILVSAFFRLYRAGDLLGFYYDQGRDALKVQEILAFKDFPAIGPTTGIAGLFLGPFWFYLLVPFYWLGRGHPAVAANFISLFDVGAVFLIYWLGKEFYNRRVGLLASLFWGFSFYLVLSGRWLSNPSPVPFFTLLLILGLGKFFIQKKEKYLILIFTSLAICLQLEMASAVFFLPVIVALWFVFRPKIIHKKYLWISFAIFFAFLIPQILFEIKNNFLMVRNFFLFNKGEVNASSSKTWALPTLAFLKERILAYQQILFSKLEVNPQIGSKFLSCLWLVFMIWFSIKQFMAKKIERQKMDTILLIFLFLPLFLLLFFVGNYGQLYDYYLTGFFPAFVLLFALFVNFFSKKVLYWPIMALIIVWFLSGNILFLKHYLTAGVDGPKNISLGNQIQAIDWIYQQTGEEKFNIDVYVPPVIPYAYDYLVPWYGQRVYHQQPLLEDVSLLFILYETDEPHPERLDAWLARQDKIAETVLTKKFGGVAVERRVRITDNKKDEKNER
jgi:4-amino-4-deoxy-L-arabinose transferase-like glycosyltransferase